MSPTTSPPGDRKAARATGAPLRADAARNVAQIRAAAIAAFRGRGLDTPLEEIAAAAGISKATIYNRFGGRAGLIDAVIENLVAAEMYAIMDKALQVSDPWQAIATYVTDRRDLQYREPAFTDALLMAYPDSDQLAAIATAAIDMTTSLVQRCHDAGVIRRTSPPRTSTTPTWPTGSPSADCPDPPVKTTIGASASSSTASAHADR